MIRSDARYRHGLPPSQRRIQLHLLIFVAVLVELREQTLHGKLDRLCTVLRMERSKLGKTAPRKGQHHYTNCAMNQLLEKAQEGP
jgi:hypothetical protein